MVEGEESIDKGGSLKTESTEATVNTEVLDAVVSEGTSWVKSMKLIVLVSFSDAVRSITLFDIDNVNLLEGKYLRWVFLRVELEEARYLEGDKPLWDLVNEW
jgi:hypothetical protein